MGQEMRTKGNASSKAHVHQGAVGGLVLGASGVVFGDIGTSPIYALHETFTNSGTSLDSIYGVTSLVFWTLMLVVTVKYLSFVMRADNNGEGGILALLSLLPSEYRQTQTKRQTGLLILILVGTALLFGDGVLTPAISVLSATEGLSLVSTNLASFSVPLTVGILLALFSVQRRGTHRIGQVFGPIMVVWFITIAGLGIYRLLDQPQVLKALSPTYALSFMQHEGLRSFTLLSSVILCVTGAEALYADMGHFGARPIRIAWGGLVAPSLVLCYLGQAALVSKHPELAASPFFALAPNKTFTFGFVILATLATVIASQALITGVFSLSRQAIQLGLFPRLTIHHTSDEHEGQIYVPIVNWLVGITSIFLVVAFKTSTALAHAYVLAIAGTMAITTVAFYKVAREVWHWKPIHIIPITIIFLIIDSAFLIGTSGNILSGGWVPVLLGSGVLLVMLIWRAGYQALNAAMRAQSRTWQQIFAGIEMGTISSVPGVGIFMAAPNEEVPAALISQVTVMHTLPERIIVVTIEPEPFPTASTKIKVDDITDRLTKVRVPVGYMQNIDLPSVLKERVLGDQEANATYFLSERRFRATEMGQLGPRTEKLFGLFHRNAATPTEYFGLPYDRVISLGTRIDL